ncbi:MAG TPA: hypothetical protein DC049_01570, partial [Spirochaetia bacterium]|nr:hypothetical protein [Spirochaetia bacterium]
IKNATIAVTCKNVRRFTVNLDLAAGMPKNPQEVQKKIKFFQMQSDVSCDLIFIFFNKEMQTIPAVKKLRGEINYKF